MVYLIIAIIVIALIAKSRSSNNQIDNDADIEKQNRILDEINRTYGNVESYEPQLEPSDVEGIYFNEFREYVNAEGRVLTPAEIDEIRYKDDYREDIEQDFPHHR
ncbi:hypothetical protein [Veillonella tobetsuensis]|jgi:hypothetical protein|uniref:Uncharacterized protein n=1 Tax=Veillonella tobetsuensis TaxID=1110546 RepID=A0A480B790_9FIRM|nr:hypothetical protein [Veillonella tobetsuensis]GCL68147.1 hypothetical protein PAGU1578_17680 [Veillonella tobetsuensis]